MSLELYLAFALATALLIVVPGPANALILANSIGHGGRRALVTVAGVSAASVVHLALVALGMTSLMALLSEGFEWLRWLGVAYLVTAFSVTLARGTLWKTREMFIAARAPKPR